MSIEVLAKLRTQGNELETSTFVRLVLEAYQNKDITDKDVIGLIDPEKVINLSYARLAPENYTETDVLSSIGVFGVGVGKIAKSLSEAARYIEDNVDFIYAVHETGPNDIHVMFDGHCKGFITAVGGAASHAAVIAIQQSKPGVIGVGEHNIQSLKSDDLVTIDGQARVVLQGLHEPIPAQKELLKEVAVIAQGIEGDTFSTKGRKKPGVKGSADLPKDVAKCIDMGADGVGLCRTEHCFFKEGRLEWFRILILADDEKLKQQALEKLYEFEKEDFVGLLQAVKGKGLRVRLLDAPLHEFMPGEHDDCEELDNLADKLKISIGELEEKIESLKEKNPMLGGNRAVRLAIMQPEIYRTQARAYMDAIVEVINQELEVNPSIFIPLVSLPKEVPFIVSIIREEQEEASRKAGFEIPLKVGIMAETPAACLAMGEIAPHIDFISCGMNDLAQMTFGFSRDDMGPAIADYLMKGILDEDPFTIVSEQVAEMVAIAAERGRRTNPKLEVSVCGAQSADHQSMTRLYAAGVDSVSVASNLVHIALIEATRAFLETPKGKPSAGVGTKSANGR